MGICIGIAGGTGSGKSTLAGYICDCFPEQTVVLEHDWYYRDQQDKTFEERLLTNYDHPDALETDRFIQELRALKAGVPIEAPVYDFTQHVRAAARRPIHPKPIIVVEGLHVLGNPELRALFDFTIFVELEETQRLARRIQRDVAERGRTRESVIQQFQSQVQPMHDQFVEPMRVFADRIVSGENRDGWGSVIEEIQTRLR